MVVSCRAARCPRLRAPIAGGRGGFGCSAAASAAAAQLLQLTANRLVLIPPNLPCTQGGNGKVLDI